MPQFISAKRRAHISHTKYLNICIYIQILIKGLHFYLTWLAFIKPPITKIHKHTIHKIINP